jgi:hypothetical protein
VGFEGFGGVVRARPKRAGTDITVAGRGSRRLSRPLCVNGF